VRGKISIDEFTDETVSDPVVQSMIAKTVVHQDEELYKRVKNSMPGRVTVRTKNGDEFTDEVLYPKGNPGNPMTEEEFKAKFMEMAVRVLGYEQSDELYKRASDLTGARNVSDLTPLFSPR
jgi:2-methylcitrate dehydratase